jgi:general secretion pathway protein D
VDPRVKGAMTLNSERRISSQQAFDQFAAQLRLQGFALVESAGIYKVVPEADAKVQGGAITVAGTGPAPRSGQNNIITQIYKLNHETANNLVPVLRPLISANNTVSVNPGNNSLIITDYADNLERLGKVIAAMDTANATEVEVIPLKHVVAQDISGIVARFAEGGAGAAAAQGQTDTSYRTTIIPEPRSNSLIVRAANVPRLNFVRGLVEKLDKPSGTPGSGNIYVVPLKNADATKLANTLRAAISASAATAPAPVPGQAATPVSAVTTGGQIQADVATNSIIITASEPQYRQLRAVIDRLDERRAQVFVEALVAEVSNDRAAEFGIQWQGALGNKGDKNIGLLGTNFGSAGNNIISLAAQAGQQAPGKGLNLGLARNTDGVYVLGFLARFLESTGEGNVLSTPQVLVLDNEEAKMVVGQNVPFVTGQFTNTGTGGGGNVNPFQTIERKDVGLTLRVKPTISENGSIKMSVFHEISSVDPASRNAASGLITNKRSIESNVLVEDGGIVVLGGLLQDEYSGGAEKVPGVSEVPFFGNLFKSESRSRKKTNLMVFLRPVVVRDGATSQAYSLDRYELMRTQQKDSQPAASSVLPVNDPPLMVPLQAPKATSATPASPAKH